MSWNRREECKAKPTDRRLRWLNKQKKGVGAGGARRMPVRQTRAHRSVVVGSGGEGEPKQTGADSVSVASMPEESSVPAQRLDARSRCLVVGRLETRQDKER